MLIDNTIFGLVDKVKDSLSILRDYEKLTHGEGYFLATSGGKDSCVIKRLADMAGVKYDAHYNLTTIDPPEVVQFIRKHLPETIIDRPKEPFLRRLIYKGYPTRQARWCCEEYKERGGQGRFVITGVRRAESNKRRKRKAVESCKKDGSKMFINPIINWDDGDVWSFIRSENISYCKLYDEGWERVGCLFCPFAKQHERKMHAERYPKYVQAFVKAFDKLHTKKISEGKKKFEQWKSGEEMFYWWLSNQGSKHNEQCVIFE